MVVVQVTLVDAIEPLDVGVALVLESFPVEGGGLRYAEAVRLGLVDRLGDGGGIEGDLLGNAAASSVTLAMFAHLDSRPRLISKAFANCKLHVPNVDASSSEPLVLDNESLGAELACGFARRRKTATAAT